MEYVIDAEAAMELVNITEREEKSDIQSDDGPSDRSDN